MKTKLTLCFLSWWIVFVWSPSLLEARPPQSPEGNRPASPPAKQDQQKQDQQKPEETATEAKEAEPRRLLAIVGGDIYTVTGETIRRGTLLIENGKIKSIGRNLEIPAEAELIDATGQVITPGFVAINLGGLALRGSLTGNAKLEDALDPFDRNIKYALSAGITTGCLEIRGAGGGGGRRGRGIDDSDAPAFEDAADRAPPSLAMSAQPTPLKTQQESDQPQTGQQESNPPTDGADSGTGAAKPREVTLAELMGVELREGEPEHRYLGIDPTIGEFVTESQLDYGIENTQLCPCCGLPILPTEPIEAAPPTEEQPRRHAAVKMSFGNLEDMLLKENVFYSPAPGGLSGALNRHNWRRDVRKAREAMQTAAESANRTAAPTEAANAGEGRQRGGGAAQAQAGRGATRSAPSPLTPLLKKEVALRVTANTAGEIRDMVALAQELDYNLIIEGGVEAWLAVSELSQSGTQVIYTPRQRRDPRLGEENSSGSSIESTGIFENQGVPFAIAALSNSVSMGGIAGRDLTSLPLEAAFAVRGGASNRTALESITIVPARMMGLENRIGSIEVGKDADLLILNGEPLDYRTYVETAIVAGKVCYQRDKDQVIPVFERK
jgi:imidazolonepropionase-like amidohydrolase